MGVYIKGMKMPKNCLECEIRAYDANAGEEYCPFSQIECLSIGLQKNCPLVEVPEPHGRLIDADALVKMSGVTVQVTGKENAVVVAQALESIYQDIDDAPTVIEAEGE